MGKAERMRQVVPEKAVRRAQGEVAREAVLTGAPLGGAAVGLVTVAGAVLAVGRGAEALELVLAAAANLTQKS
jgi:hypothetical protein